MMKKILLLVALVVNLNYSFAQTTKQNIERDFINFNQLISEKNIDAALEYSYPKLFEIIPKEKMKSLLEAVYKMPNIEYKISTPIINAISDVKSIDNIDYVKIQYISPFEMKMKDIDLNDEHKLQMLLQSFENKFGKANVDLDKTSGFFKINAQKEVIAISTNNQNDWKFVTIDNPRMKVLLEKIIPSEVLE